MSRRIYIRDDSGLAWYYDEKAGRIKCLAAELIHEPDNGYPCDTLEEGIELLNEHGYIVVSKGEESRRFK